MSIDAVLSSCRDGDVAMFQDLIGRSSSSLGIQDSAGFNPLIMACKYGHIAIVHYILKQSSDSASALFHKTQVGNDALMYACASNHLDIVQSITYAMESAITENKALHQRKPTRNTAKDSWIHWAAMTGSVTLMKHLAAFIQRVWGDKVLEQLMNAQNRSKMTPLMCAVSSGSVELVRWMKEMDAVTATKDIFGRGASDYVGNDIDPKAKSEITELLLSTSEHPKPLTNEEIIELFEEPLKLHNVSRKKTRAQVGRDGQKSSNRGSPKKVEKSEPREHGNGDQESFKDESRLSDNSDGSDEVASMQQIESCEGVNVEPPEIERDRSGLNRCEHHVELKDDASAALAIQSRHLFGEGLSDLSYCQLQEVEHVLHESLLKVRQEKDDRQQRFNTEVEVSLQELSLSLSMLYRYS